MRTWARRGCPSAGCTTPHAASVCPVGGGPRGRGTGQRALSGGCMPRRAGWGTGAVCGPGAGCSTAASCRTAGRARLPAVPRPLGGASGRLAPASAAWLFCSETKPAGTRRGWLVTDQGSAGGRDLWAVLQPATRGPLTHFDFGFCNVIKSRGSRREGL